MIEQFVKDIKNAQAGNDKIELTQKQLSSIEALMVGYMTIAKNEAGFDDATVEILLGELDKTWDSNFKVVSK